MEGVASPRTRFTPPNTNSPRSSKGAAGTAVDMEMWRSSQMLQGPKIDDEAESSVHNGAESLDFWQLLAELARAHNREVQLARSKPYVPPSAQAHISDAGPSSNRPDSSMDEVPEVRSLIQNLMLLARQSSLAADCPPNPSAPNTSMPGNLPFAPHALTTSAENRPEGMEENTQQIIGKPSQQKLSEPGSLNVPRHESKRSTRSLLRISAGSVGPGSTDSDTANCIARMKKMLKCGEFEFAIALAIICNALVMFYEFQYVGLDIGFNLQYPGHIERAHIIWTGADTVFFVCDWFFGVLFLLELLLKLICFRSKYFFVSGKLPNKWKHPLLRRCWRVQGWNVLDFLCVVAFLFDKIASSSAVNPQMFRLLRLFRLFRLVRLLRFLEGLDHLYVMTTAICGLSKVLLWAVVLLTIMLLTCDLFLVQVLQVTYFDNVTNLSDDQLKQHRHMFSYFGTSTRCLLTMFEITLGNWPPVARLLAEEVSEWFTIVCLLHKLTIGFSVIGVITGIILQETFKVAQTDDMIMLRAKERQMNTLKQKMRHLFNTLDEGDDGQLTLPEFEKIGEVPEIKTWLASLDIETDDLKVLFDLIDKDGDGHITLEELVARMPRIKGTARGIDVLAIKNKLSYDISQCKSILQGSFCSP